MKFNYSAVISCAPDTGEHVVIFRPEVRIRVRGPKGVDEYLALVDTGTDNTILPESLAHDLGIRLTVGKGPAAMAFGGQELALSYADVEFELVHPDGNLQWLSRAYFVADESDGEETLILGRQGFLDYFSAIFDGEECTLDLQAKSYLPTIKDPSER